MIASSCRNAAALVALTAGSAWAGIGDGWHWPHRGNARTTTITTVTPAPLSYVMVPVAASAPAQAQAPVYSSPPAAAAWPSGQSYAAASSRAVAAPQAEVDAIAARYPGLARAAAANGIGGGRFVVFLKTLAREAAKIATGPVAREIVIALIRAQLGLDATTGPLATEVDDLVRDDAPAPPRPADHCGPGCSCRPERVAGPTPVPTPIPTLDPVPTGPSHRDGVSVVGDGRLPLAAPAELAPPPPSIPPASADDRRHREVLDALDELAKAVTRLAEAQHDR